MVVFGAAMWLSQRQEPLTEGVRGPPLTCDEAVALAEQFVRENGYTDAPDRDIKHRLDGEGLEWTSDRSEQLRLRRNTLLAKAIGIKATDQGWGVAFEYASDRSSCRVVTMAIDGSSLRMQHQDGIREYWAGFSEQ